MFLKIGSGRSMMRQHELFDLLDKEGLTPDMYYLLVCFHDNVAPKRINVITVLKELQQTSHIAKTQDGSVIVTFEGYNLIKKVERYFKKEKAGSKKVDSEFTANVEAYRELFPSIKLPSGVYARSAVKNLEPAMIWFFENFNYSWDTVLKATKLYINEYEMNRWKYLKNSQYFIRKENVTKQWVSELANYCENILNGADENEKNFFETKVV